MMRGRVVRIAAGVTCTLLLAAPLALAQTASDLVGQGAPPPITLSLSTTYPQPDSSDTLVVQSTLLTLANATLAVSVNGTQIYNGNVQPIAVAIGGAGVPTNISVVVTSQGQSYPASLSVTPGDVSLVEEPLSSAPPLYAGKPEVALGGEVRLVAVAGFRTASGAAINPANLSYTWMQGGDTLGSSSGIGKSAIIVAAPLQYRAGDYSVTVTTQDGTQAGSASVSIAAENPSVRIYADDPLLGIEFNKALGGTYTINGPEASFYAAPFSFSTVSGAPALQWFLGGASSAQSGNLITLRPTSNTAGQSTLSVSASESQQYESATAGLTLSYGAAASGGGIFGL
jgi:hypothetical protein